MPINYFHVQQAAQQLGIEYNKACALVQALQLLSAEGAEAQFVQTHADNKALLGRLSNQQEAEPEGERDKLLRFLLADWHNSMADDVTNTFQAMWQVLKNGFIGYANMPIQQLRKEAEDAGYPENDDE